MTDKGTMRAQALANRRSLSIDHQRVCDAIAHFLRQRAKHLGRPLGGVVSYSAMDGEPDLSALAGLDDLGQLCLTRTPDGDSRILTLHPADSELETHRFGFTQPVAGAPVVPDADIDVVLVPGLAFDRQGGRLGFGGGYYDRLLSRLDPRTCCFVAVSGGFIVANVPLESHDVAMTHLASEAGVVPLPLG